MFGRRRGYSAKMSKRTSRRMESSMIGSHHAHGGAAPTGRHASSAPTRRQSARRQEKAERGEIEAIIPKTATRESSNAHRQRVSQNDRYYIEERHRRVRLRRIIISAVVAVAIVALAVFVGVQTYFGTVGSELALRDSDAESALVSADANSPYYVLIATELGSVAEPLDNDGPDMLLLVRVDAANKHITIVNIPSNLQVTSGNSKIAIADTAASGDAALIEQVSKLTGVSIAHYVEFDQSDFVDMVDAMGGIEVNISQAIDDPHAGTWYLEAGEQTLSGEEALIYLRANNLSEGVYDRIANQSEFAMKMIEEFFRSDGTLSFASRLDSLGSYLQTDYSSNDLVSLADKLGGLSDDDFTLAVIPGYESSSNTLVANATTLYVADSDDIAQLMASVDAGGGATDAEGIDTSSVDPASFTVEVQNGANIDGAATATSSVLSSNGFNVVKTGNAEQSVYTETLVVYQDDAYKADAQAVVDAMGFGRVVNGMGYYTTDADVLVVIGSDYKPSA